MNEKGPPKDVVESSLFGWGTAPKIKIDNTSAVQRVLNHQDRMDHHEKMRGIEEIDPESDDEEAKSANQPKMTEGQSESAVNPSTPQPNAEITAESEPGSSHQPSTFFEKHRKKLLATIALVIGIGAGVGAYHLVRGENPSNTTESPSNEPKNTNPTTPEVATTKTPLPLSTPTLSASTQLPTTTTSATTLPSTPSIKKSPSKPRKTTVPFE